MTKEDALAIGRVSKEVFAIACDHGFHADEDVDVLNVSTERMAKYCANLHGEVSELWEATRHGTLDISCDKAGCDLTCVEEELADIVIRAMDCAEGLGIDLGMAILTKSEFNSKRSYMHGKLA
jgi:NTP pyrophosphatase (non-canonical NTP hydrolase)